MAKLDTQKSDYRERTGTEWFGVRASVSVSVSVRVMLELVIEVSVNSNPNPNLTLKLTTRFQSFLGNLIV